MASKHILRYEHTSGLFDEGRDPDTVVFIQCERTTWDELAELFPRYLIACGFVLTEKDLARFYGGLTREES